MRERQEGRYYGLGISIQVVDGEITVFPLFEGSPAYQRGVRRGDVIAQDRGRRTPRAGRAIRPCGCCAARAERRCGFSIKRSGYDKLIDLEVTARRDPHSDGAGRVHAGRDDRLHPAVRFRRELRRRDGARAAGPARQGHAAPRARPAQQSRRRAGSGDPRQQPVPPARRHDRVHARTRAELGSGLPRHASRATISSCR